MKGVLTVAVMISCLSGLLWADFGSVTEEADRLNQEEKHETAKEFLLKSLKSAQTDNQSAELYWRLARAALYLADEAEKAGADKETLLEMFAQGEEYGQKSIENNPNNPLAYFWKSSNIGRWGQTKGILNALFKATDVRDLLVEAINIDQDYADAYYVLGQLYDQVPGFISFGNMDFAVSLGRKAVYLRERQVSAGVHERLNYDYYTELAKHLYKRNWMAVKRIREIDKKKRQLESAQSVLDKSCYFEATVQLKDMSDRDEAVQLLKWVIAELEVHPDRMVADDDDLREAKEELAAWNR